MIKTKPLALAQKLKNIVDICEAADTEIENQKLIQKGALDAGKENDGIEPAVVRKILARRKKLAKDPAETTRLEDLMTDYQFMLGEGREDTRPWTQADDEVSRVIALTNTSKPPKIEAIKKALGCSQGKAHKLRSIAAVRLAKKSSSSFDEREHEHLPQPQDGDDGITGGEHGQAEPDFDAAPAVGGGKAEGGRDRSAILDACSAGEGGIEAGGDACGGAQRVRCGGGSEAEAADPVRLTNEAPATPSVGAVADDDLAIPPHLRGPSPANRRMA